MLDLGVDYDGLPLREAPYLVREGSCNHALGVIGHDYDVHAFHGLFDVSQDLFHDGFRDMVFFFPVEPYDLLVVRYDARLYRRLAPRIGYHSARGYALSREHALQFSSVAVIADNARCIDLRSEASQVIDDVRASAEKHCFFRNLNHGHRRLRRDARNLAPDEMIHYEVARDQDTRLIETPYERGRPPVT